MKNKVLLIVGLSFWTALTVWISLTVVIFYLPDTFEQDRAVRSCFRDHEIPYGQRSNWHYFIRKDGAGIHVLLDHQTDNTLVTTKMCQYDSDWNLRWKA